MPLRLSPQLLTCLLACFVPLLLVLSLATGSVAIPLSSLWQALTDFVVNGSASSLNSTIVFNIRLPRILLALCVGAILAATGTLMQGLFRNPLADPSLIGVSSGASVGASLVIVAAAPWLQFVTTPGLTMVALGAFTGGFCATLLVYRLATSNLGTSVTTMLLAGIAISAFAGALNSLLSYFADNDMLRQISLWQMGNLSTANWPRVAMMAGVALLLCVSLPHYSLALNALLLGESEARYLGIDVQKIKQRLILLTALGVGVSVAVAGIVAFVGLVVPHLIRLLIGPDHRWLLPCSALGGAVLLILADNLSRTLISPAELPAGILTALLGAPFFVAMLLQQRRRL